MSTRRSRENYWAGQAVEHNLQHSWGRSQMNIFNVLSQGKSRLHEPAISAMLGFLLSTHRDHGLGDSFLRAFLTLLQSKASVPLVKALMDRPFIDTDISLEEPYQLGNLR